MDWEVLIGIVVFVALVYGFLRLTNKFLVKMFDIVSSFAVVASIFVVIYPPYQLSIPKLIELNLGRYLLWEPPSAQTISNHLPDEFKAILPKLISDQNISLLVNIDQAALFSNLASIFLIYLVVLTIYLTHKNET